MRCAFGRDLLNKRIQINMLDGLTLVSTCIKGEGD